MKQDAETDRRLGITTTVPVEIILAAGLIPVDLNNRFIASPDPLRLTAAAEARGFPVNLCSWVKGVYAAARELALVRVLGVVRGDCSSTDKLLEIFRHEGLEVVVFAYPFRPDREAMARELRSLGSALGTDLAAAEEQRQRLAGLRDRLRDLDELTWQDARVSGEENHAWLVAASDFNGDPVKFQSELERFLAEARSRPGRRPRIRLGYVGVPPIVSDLYRFCEARGAAVVFNEVQRQFAMLGPHADLVEQYCRYTYPYELLARIADVRQEVAVRGVQGIIHYAQTFCHRQLEAILLREELPVPVLTMEADQPGPLEPRTRTRIEAFLEQIG